MTTESSTAIVFKNLSLVQIKLLVSRHTNKQKCLCLNMTAQLQARQEVK